MKYEVQKNEGKDDGVVWVINPKGRPVDVQAWRLERRPIGDDLLNKGYRVCEDPEKALEEWNKTSKSYAVHQKYVKIQKKRDNQELEKVIEAVEEVKEKVAAKPKKKAVKKEEIKEEETI